MLLTLAALYSRLNARFLRQPAGIMLALSRPAGLPPEVCVPMTFAVVLFSAAGQGLALKPLLSWLTPRAA